MRKSVVIFFLILSALGFYLANRYTAELLLLGGFWMDKTEVAFDVTLSSILKNPFYISTGQWPVLIGLCGFITVLFAWTISFALPKPQRVGEEYGSARFGTIAEAKKFKAPKRKARRKIRLSNHA
jgi:type IV secretion system protein VirD4